MSRSSASALGARIAAALVGARSSGPIVVGVSGGVDSLALLHLALVDPELRAAIGGGGEPPAIVAAHLDHAMRPDSAAHAAALAGWAGREGVEFRTRRLPVAPSSEAEARDVRYAFLEDVADELRASMVWTAHHADDQVETVLFRILRGSGVAGLAGIPAHRGRIVRPFLLASPPVGRDELEAYADRCGLPVLEDPTNADPGHAARNRLRHEVLPLLERAAPGASDRLLRLARNARRASDEHAAAVDWILDRVRGRGEGSVPASLWAEAGRPLRRALLRRMADRLGVALPEAATEAALALAPDAQSGRGVDLPGGLRFERSFDRWTLVRRTLDRPSPAPDGRDAPDDHVVIVGGGEGEARIETAPGRRCRVRWAIAAEPAADEVPGPAWRVALPVDPRAFPLTLRGWRAGDRMARPFGTIALAKAWAEARVPRRERPGRAVLVDRHGTVLAAEGLGVARSGPTVHQADAAGTTGPTLLALALEPEGRLHEMPVADPRAGSHTIERVVFSEEDLARRIEQLGREIAEAAPEDEEILLVGMLKGSFLFLADLARAIPRPVRLDFMVAASYHAGTVSSGEVTLKYEPDTSLKGRFVVIVEDIIDSGTTLSRLLPVFEAQEPAHLEVCALLHKRLVTLDPPARFVGFDAPPAFLVGYGLDFAEQFRNLPYIGVLQADEG